MQPRTRFTLWKRFKYIFLIPYSKNNTQILVIALVQGEQGRTPSPRMVSMRFAFTLQSQTINLLYKVGLNI